MRKLVFISFVFALTLLSSGTTLSASTTLHENNDYEISQIDTSTRSGTSNMEKM